MAKQTVNTGTSANSRNGDSLRAAFTKINANFTELYPRTVPSTSQGTLGDVKGMMAVDYDYLYICVADYDDSTVIWRRVAWSNDTW